MDIKSDVDSVIDGPCGTHGQQGTTAYNLFGHDGSVTADFEYSLSRT